MRSIRLISIPAKIHMRKAKDRYYPTIFLGSDSRKKLGNLNKQQSVTIRIGNTTVKSKINIRKAGAREYPWIHLKRDSANYYENQKVTVIIKNKSR